jgi:hypothetical protein
MDAKVRPPVRYTNALKVKQMPIYELVGSPSDPLETRLKRQICKRQITPARARAAIRSFKFTNG